MRFFFFFFIPFHIRNQLIFFGFVSIGTDGTRTRSFRLDRAVLWPIELQSQGKSCIAYIFLLFHSNPLFFYFRFEPLYCNWKRQTYILIFLWVCTLAKSTRIIRNPFLIANLIEKSMNQGNKKDSFFTLILS